MRYVKPSLNGANFAIRTQSYINVDGIEQPLTKEGVPLQGFDRRLAYKMLENGGDILQMRVGVLTSPRRYVNLMLNDASKDGTIYGSKGMVDIRNSVNPEIIQRLPREVIEAQVDKILRSLFEVYVYQTYTVSINKINYWDKAQKLLSPYEHEFVNDIQSDKGEDISISMDLLWKKYKKVFLTHLNELVKNDKRSEFEPQVQEK